MTPFTYYALSTGSCPLGFEHRIGQLHLHCMQLPQFRTRAIMEPFPKQLPFRQRDFNVDNFAMKGALNTEHATASLHNSSVHEFFIAMHDLVADCPNNCLSRGYPHEARQQTSPHRTDPFLSGDRDQSMQETLVFRRPLFLLLGHQSCLDHIKRPSCAWSQACSAKS
jgi:hypothetical protein